MKDRTHYKVGQCGIVPKNFGKTLFAILFFQYTLTELKYGCFELTMHYMSSTLVHRVMAFIFKGKIVVCLEGIRHIGAMRGLKGQLALGYPMPS